MATLRKRHQNRLPFDFDDYDDEPSEKESAAYALLDIIPLIGDAARFTGRHGGKPIVALAAVALIALGAQYIGHNEHDRSSTASVSSPQHDPDVTGSVSR